MRLEQLAYFVKIADKKSLTYASDELFISQQALSTSIKNLEEEFQTKFFVRTPRGMVLSEDGKYFYEIAVKILNLSHELYEHFTPSDTPEIGTLSIGINKRNKNYFFTKVISSFYKNYQQYNIDYKIMNRKDVMPAVVNNQVDIGVISILKINKKFVLPLPEELEFFPFHISEYSLLTCKDSPLSVFNTISMETAVKYPIILMAESDLINDLFYEMVMQYEESPNIIWADSTELQEQMVEDGLGNMFITRNDVLPKKAVVRVQITNHILVESGFLLSKRAEENPLRDLFVREAGRIISDEKYI